jgi:hypothetical protein
VEIGEKLREKIDNYTPDDKSKGQALVAPDSRKHPSLSNLKKSIQLMKTLQNKRVDKFNA